MTRVVKNWPRHQDWNFALLSKVLRAEALPQ